MRAFVVLVILSALLGGAFASIRKQNELRRRARSQESVRAFLSIPYKYDYTKTVAAAAAETCKKSDAESDKSQAFYYDTLAVRTNKFEAAISMAVQHNPAMIDVLKEMIQREICMAEIAFDFEACKSKDKNNCRDIIVGNLFALPGKGPGSAEDAWVTAMCGEKAEKAKSNDAKDVAAHHKCLFEKQWINLDNSRSGMWVGDQFAANMKAFEEIIQSEHYREILHTLTRASLYGEDITKVDEIATKAKGSLRHAIVVLLGDETKKQAAITKCGFSPLRYDKANSGKKTFFGNAAEGVVLQAREPYGTDKAFRAFASGKNHVGKPLGCDDNKTRVSNNLMRAIGMPELTDREIEYFDKYYALNDKAWKGGAGKGNSKPVDDDKPVPWGYGACVWNMVDQQHNTLGKRVPLTENRNWMGAMIGDGLAVDAGPSGTTDEILSVADWLGLTDNLYSFCALRDVAFANMIIAEHHSYGEVVQGSFDNHRQAGKDFKFSDPWASLIECDKASNDLSALFLPNKKLRDSVHRFGTAVALVSDSTFNSAWDALAKTDYANHPVPHLFKDEDVSILAAQKWDAFNRCVCTRATGNNCARLSIEVAVGCRKDWDVTCFGAKPPTPTKTGLVMLGPKPQQPVQPVSKPKLKLDF